MSNKDARKPANADYSPVDTSTTASATAPVPFGAGKGLPDLRETVRGLTAPGFTRAPLSDDDVLNILDDCDSFLWQVVSITSRVLETVDVGEVRTLVAAEIAMPGDVVLADGSIHKSRTAPGVAAKSRAASHPLIALVKLAMQAVRLLKQISQGTHPEAHNRRKRTPKEESTLNEVDKAFDAMFKKCTAT